MHILVHKISVIEHFNVFVIHQNTAQDSPNGTKIFLCVE